LIGLIKDVLRKSTGDTNIVGIDLKSTPVFIEKLTLWIHVPCLCISLWLSVDLKSGQTMLVGKASEEWPMSQG